MISKVLETCPNWQWRTVVALARFGGLRCSSEVALLKLNGIHWDADRFTITSPKTKRYGKATRIVPLFPELRPFLDEAFAMAETGGTWVIPMLDGKPSKNLGATFKKIIHRAGVDAWPKPFQNLRSSRQTELERKFPTHVTCAWLGNTPRVAQNRAHKWRKIRCSRRTHPIARTGKKRQNPLTGRGLGEIVRLLTSLCQRSKWRGQDAKSLLFSGGKRTF